jgi:hypothetical protein
MMNGFPPNPRTTGKVYSRILSSVDSQSISRKLGSDLKDAGLGSPIPVSATQMKAGQSSHRESPGPSDNQQPGLQSSGHCVRPA